MIGTEPPHGQVVHTMFDTINNIFAKCHDIYYIDHIQNMLLIVWLRVRNCSA